MSFTKEEDFIRFTRSTHIHEDKENRQPRKNIVQGSHPITSNPNTAKMNCLKILKGSPAQSSNAA
jgi:hypothetical protein